MVERTYGRFPYYQDLHATAESRVTTGASIRQSLLQARAHAVGLGELAKGMAEDTARAARLRAEVGELEAPVELDVAAVRRLASHGAYACGVMAAFADSVDDFDRAVNEVNVAFHRQSAEQITAAVAAAGLDADGRPNAVDRADIRDRVEVELTPQWRRANAALEEASDLAVARLRDGLRSSDALELIRAGHIPVAVVGCFDDLELTDADLAAAADAVVPEVSLESLLEFLGVWASAADAAEVAETADEPDAAPSTWLRAGPDDPWAPGTRSASGASDRDLYDDPDDPVDEPDEPDDPAAPDPTTTEAPSWSGADAWGMRSGAVLSGLGAAWRDLDGAPAPTVREGRGPDAWRDGRAERPGVGSSLGGLLGGWIGRAGGSDRGPETDDEINDRLSGPEGP